MGIYDNYYLEIEKMTTKICNTCNLCKNCGHEDIDHRKSKRYNNERGSCRECKCKKFEEEKLNIAINSYIKKPKEFEEEKGCGKQIIIAEDFTVGCGDDLGYLCRDCKKPKNNSPDYPKMKKMKDYPDAEWGTSNHSPLKVIKGTPSGNSHLDNKSSETIQPEGTHSPDDLSRKSVNPDKRKIAQDTPSGKSRGIISSEGIFNLSEKMISEDEWAAPYVLRGHEAVLFKEDIKTFIKKCEEDLRKKKYPFTYDEVVEILHKRAGKELC